MCVGFGVRVFLRMVDVMVVCGLILLFVFCRVCMVLLLVCVGCLYCCVCDVLQ